MTKLHEDEKLLRNFAFTPPEDSLDQKWLSLKNALYNYFKTADIVLWEWNIGFLGYPQKNTDEDFVFSLPEQSISEYQNSYIQTIWGLHNFIELYLKDILKGIDERLVLSYDNLKELANILDLIDGEDQHTISFTECLNRLNKLVGKTKENNGGSVKILDSKYDILVGQHQPLRKSIELLNHYRNQITHKGEKILKYSALDYFMVHHAFPLLKKIFEFEPKIESMLLHFPDSRISIIEEISDEKFKLKLQPWPEISASVKAIKKIGQLKAMGFASMNLPRGYTNTMLTLVKFQMGFKFGVINMQFILSGLWEIEKNMKEAEDACEKLIDSSEKIYKCPVCGLMTLHVTASQKIGEDKETGQAPLDNASCNYCKYSTHAGLGEPADFGILPHKIYS